MWHNLFNPHNLTPAQMAWYILMCFAFPLAGWLTGSFILAYRKKKRNG